MTNDEIIYNEVNAKYHTPEQRRAILALAYTPEQIAAKGKEIHFKGVPEEHQGEELEKLLLAGLFHTFQEWKKDGKSVKTGEKATICTKLWKFDDRPRKTSASMEPDALTAAANDQRPLYHITLPRMQRTVKAHLGDSCLGQLNGLSRRLDLILQYPGALLTDIGDFHHV